MAGAEAPTGCSCVAPIEAEEKGLLQNKEGKESVQRAPVWGRGREEDRQVCCFREACFHPLVCAKPGWEIWKLDPHPGLPGFHMPVQISGSPRVWL